MVYIYDHIICDCRKCLWMCLWHHAPFLTWQHSTWWHHPVTTLFTLMTVKRWQAYLFDPAALHFSLHGYQFVSWKYNRTGPPVRYVRQLLPCSWWHDPQGTMLTAAWQWVNQVKHSQLHYLAHIPLLVTSCPQRSGFHQHGLSRGCALDHWWPLNTSTSWRASSSCIVAVSLPWWPPCSYQETITVTHSGCTVAFCYHGR